MHAKNLQPQVDPPCWEISPPDLTRFICQLSAFAPVGAVLCLEGVDAADIERFLEARRSRIENESNQGFLRMRSKVFYMPITPENTRGLGELTAVRAEPEVCSHLRVYDDEQIILSWHDLPSDPIYVIPTIDQAVLKKFCEALDCEYKFIDR